MNQPSSTITASFLAGVATTVAWELVATFTDYDPTVGLIAGSVTLISGLVGFFKKENVLNIRRP